MSDENEGYDWSDEDLVIRAQGETAVYKNEHDGTVIRQRDPFSGDEQFVVISPGNLAQLIRRLQQHHAENRRAEEQG